MKPRSFEEVERHLTNHAEPLAKLRLAEIDPRTIAVRLAEIEEVSGQSLGTECDRAFPPSSPGPSPKASLKPIPSPVQARRMKADRGNGR